MYERKCIAETHKRILIFVKYEYESKFGPSEELYDMKVDTQTTIKYVKNKLDGSFMFGELEPNQYSIYKNGEEEDKDKNQNREPMNYYYQI